MRHLVSRYAPRSPWGLSSLRISCVPALLTLLASPTHAAILTWAADKYTVTMTDGYLNSPQFPDRICISTTGANDNPCAAAYSTMLNADTQEWKHVIVSCESETSQTCTDRLKRAFPGRWYNGLPKPPFNYYLTAVMLSGHAMWQKPATGVGGGTEPGMCSTTLQNNEIKLADVSVSTFPTSNTSGGKTTIQLTVRCNMALPYQISFTGSSVNGYPDVLKNNSTAGGLGVRIYLGASRVVLGERYNHNFPNGTSTIQVAGEAYRYSGEQVTPGGISSTVTMTMTMN